MFLLVVYSLEMSRHRRLVSLSRISSVATRITSKNPVNSLDNYSAQHAVLERIYLQLDKDDTVQRGNKFARQDTARSLSEDRCKRAQETLELETRQEINNNESARHIYLSGKKSRQNNRPI